MPGNGAGSVFHGVCGSACGSGRAEGRRMGRMPCAFHHPDPTVPLCETGRGMGQQGSVRLRKEQPREWFVSTSSG